MNQQPNQNAFIVTVLFNIAAPHVEQFHEAVLQQAQVSLKREQGCLRFDVCVDPNDRCRIFLYEVYTSKAAFDEHLASDHFCSFNELVTPWTADKRVETWKVDQ